MTDKDTSPKAGTTDAKDTKKDIEKAHQVQGRPVSPTDDPTDHSVPASQIAKQVDPKATSSATVNAKSMDTMNRADEAKEDKGKLEEDQSVGGKLRRSGLFFVRDHSTGMEYIGISPANDPNASMATKTRSQIQSIDSVSPRTGMVVKPKDGDAFTVPEGYGPDSTPDRWMSVVDPTTKKPLFA
jgi:hypothetical protein